MRTIKFWDDDEIKIDKDKPPVSPEDVMSWLFVLELIVFATIYMVCLIFFKKEVLFISFVFFIAYAKDWTFDKKIFEEAGVKLN